MTDWQNLIDRNRRFAALYEGNLAMMPRFSTIVLTCADARVDPAYVLGLELGDAVVFRKRRDRSAGYCGPHGESPRPHRAPAPFAAGAEGARCFRPPLRRGRWQGARDCGSGLASHRRLT